jgi:hypothetical protein
MKVFRRSTLAVLACVGLMTVASAPAWAQVERVYTGVTPPVLGGVLGESGERPAVSVTPAQTPTQQVLPLQVSGAAGATQQAPVQGLAFTGADVASLVVIALFAITVGTVLARRARPRNVA